MNTKYQDFVKECKEVAEGSRGFAKCSKVRAADMGLQHGSLTVAAKALGLKIDRHGKYGYCAIK